MAERQRDPRETKALCVKGVKDMWEKNHRTTMPREKLREIEKMYEKQILPRAYEQDKK